MPDIIFVILLKMMFIKEPIVHPWQPLLPVALLTLNKLLGNPPSDDSQLRGY